MRIDKPKQGTEKPTTDSTKSRSTCEECFKPKQIQIPSLQTQILQLVKERHPNSAKQTTQSADEKGEDTCNCLDKDEILSCTSVESSESETLTSTLSISPPILPLAFANAMLTLYAVQSPEDCKLHLLVFCLMAGSITLFMSVLGLVAGYVVKMAVADGRVSHQERSVIWCIVNQNNFLVGVQVTVFLTLFCYVFAYFNTVNHTDQSHPAYCKRNVYMFCLVLSSVMVAATFIAAFFYFWLWLVDTRRQRKKPSDSSA